MKRRICAKLKSRAGETIAETLISVLIGAAALVMLAGAVTAACNVVTSSKEAMELYYTGDAAMVERTATNSSGTVEITQGATASSYNVYFYKNDKIKNYKLNDPNAITSVYSYVKSTT